MLAVRSILGTLVELWQFLAHGRRRWLLPLIVVLALFTGLIILGSIPVLQPLIYPLF